MIRFINSFIKSGKDRPSELVALLCSVLLSFVFVGWFILLYDAFKPQPQIVMPSGPPLMPRTIVQVQELGDSNAKFRVVPENFSRIDFNNWSYGAYRFGGKKLNLTLQGERVFPDGEGGGETFSLSDVLYTDITGDGKPEAIVILSHVECAVSCDGGSDLIYIYENRKNTPRKLWAYESGSMAFGCGMKSLTITNKQIALEMFGQCWKPASSFEGSGKFLVRDLTRLIFHYNGRRFVKKSTQVTAAPATDVRNYRTQVQIKDSNPPSKQILK